MALSEPIAPGKYADRMPDREAVADGIEDFYRDMRKMALGRGLVISKHVGGVVPDNTKGMGDGRRQRIAEKGKIAVGKDLEEDFYLAIKLLLSPTLAREPASRERRAPRSKVKKSRIPSTSRLLGVASLPAHSDAGYQ